MTQVAKKTREDKDRLFENIRNAVPEFQHCFVFSVDNMRNNHLKTVRHELLDCRYVEILLPPTVSSSSSSSFFFSQDGKETKTYQKKKKKEVSNTQCHRARFALL